MWLLTLHLTPDSYGRNVGFGLKSHQNDELHFKAEVSLVISGTGTPILGKNLCHFWRHCGTAPAWPNSAFPCIKYPTICKDKHCSASVDQKGILFQIITKIPTICTVVPGFTNASNYLGLPPGENSKFLLASLFYTCIRLKKLLAMNWMCRMWWCAMTHHGEA